MAITLAEIADSTGTRLIGDGSCIISRIDDIESAGPGSIAFLSNNKYKEHLSSTNASAIIIKSEFVDICKTPALVTEDPRLLFAKVANMLNPPKSKIPGVSKSAIIHKGAKIDPSAYIGPGAVIDRGAVISSGAQIESGCIIGEEVLIGENTRLYPNVTIYDKCRIGQDTIIHSGAVIGADGFGFVKDGDAYLKIPQTGSVTIGNKVEIGANTTIDRGAISDTVIEDGVKIDNQVQIAHSVHIGKHTVISAATAIAGSTTIGNGCLIGGVVGIVEHINITDNVIITGRTMVTRSITRPGSYSSSTPMDETVKWRKNSARFRQLDDIAKRVGKLEKNKD